MQENSPLLQLQNVGYLAGDAKILNNINFSLRAGEFKLIKVHYENLKSRKAELEELILALAVPYQQ